MRPSSPRREAARTLSNGSSSRTPSLRSDTSSTPASGPPETFDGFSGPLSTFRGALRSQTSAHRSSTTRKVILPLFQFVRGRWLTRLNAVAVHSPLPVARPYPTPATSPVTPARPLFTSLLEQQPFLISQPPTLVTPYFEDDAPAWRQSSASYSPAPYSDVQSQWAFYPCLEIYKSSVYTSAASYIQQGNFDAGATYGNDPTLYLATGWQYSAHSIISSQTPSSPCLCRRACAASSFYSFVLRWLIR